VIGLRAWWLDSACCECQKINSIQWIIVVSSIVKPGNSKPGPGPGKTKPGIPGKLGKYGPLILAVGLLLVILLAANKMFSASGIDTEQLAIKIAAMPHWQLAGLFLFAILFTAVGLPRQLVAFISGFVFGLVPGVLVSLCASLLGCILAFWVSRGFLSGWVRQRYGKAAKVLDRLIQHDAFVKIVVLRLQPFGTNLLTNVCAGVSGIKPLVFFLSTAIGYLPQLIVFALAGDGIRLGEQSRLLISAVLLLVSLVLALWLWRRHKMRLDSD